MEKKRKLPPRGAAKAESSSKKRASTPPEHRSSTHTPTPAAGSGPQSALATEMDLDEPPVPQRPEPLPTSVAPGKPLPTVEEPQPDDLPVKDFQSIQESGVLAESLHRSRQKWISEGIFEKYWTKPRGRGGTKVEDPKNPPKDTMVKLGQVTIIVEPHVFETTMYGVKDVKPPPPPPTTQAAFRPIVQYGPPNGVAPPPLASAPMPTPPPKIPTPPTAATTAPAPATSAPSTPAPHPPPASTVPQAPAQGPIMPAAQPQQSVPSGGLPRPNPSPSPAPAQQPPAPSPVAPQPPVATAPAPSPVPAQAAVPSPSLPGPMVAPTPPPNPTNPVASPRGMGAVLSPTAAVPQPQPQPQPQQAPRPASSIPPLTPAGVPPPGTLPADRPLVGPMIHGPLPPGIPPPPPSNRPNGPGPANTVAMPPGAPGPGPARPAAAHPPGADPIILTLAEKATEDPHLRDLMKRVANGQASKAELEGFQAIIDQITAESKRKGAVQGPSADRLVVDGRTVRYFADEVRAILDIVFASNPKQTSADLRPPAGSDPLVVLLVKSALDDVKVRDMVRRIANNQPQFSDATDLKHVLDRLRTRVARDQERQRTQSPAVASALKPNGAAPPAASAGPSATHVSHPPPAQQALRSKGPPPVARPDFSAVLFEFQGGTGDRYLFPKFSIAELIQLPGQGHQVIASFIIVRKGSTSEHGGDPNLDYYQPITIRLLASTHRHLEIIPRIVAPVEQVRSYMDDVMSHMTRAEYVLLAMRLPRKEKEDEAIAEKGQTSGTVTATTTPTPNGELQIRQVQPMQGVLWTAKAQATPPRQKPAKKPLTEDEQYHHLITSLTPREVEEV